MDRLAQSDLEALLGLIRRLESFETLDQFHAGALPLLRELVPYDSASYKTFRGAHPRWVWTIEPADMYPVVNRRAFEREAHQHPVVGYGRGDWQNYARKISDFASLRELHRLVVYQDFLRPIDVEHQITIGVPIPRVAICLNRGRPDFSERDRMLLDLVRPHLIHNYRNLEARGHMHRALAALENWDEHAGRAVVLLGPAGKVELASGGAGRWFEAYLDGSAAGPDRLPDTLESWLYGRTGRLNGGSEVPRPPEPLVIERGGGRLTVRFVPATTAGELDALVLEERRGSVSVAELAHLGLSPRQTEVLASVAAGMTNAEIAYALDISPRTVQKHLEQVFRKLEVSTRTAAAARAFEAVGAPGAPDGEPGAASGRVVRLPAASSWAA